jgi:hypothetical protein
MGIIIFSNNYIMDCPYRVFNNPYDQCRLGIYDKYMFYNKNENNNTKNTCCKNRNCTECKSFSKISMQKNYNNFIAKMKEAGDTEEKVNKYIKELSNNNFYKLLEEYYDEKKDDEKDEKNDEKNDDENAITLIHKIDYHIRNMLLSSKFYQNYMKRILMEKILFEKKSLINKNNKIKYLQDKFLHDCTPDSIYKWWLDKKTKYKNDSGNWMYNLDKNELLYFIINQILHILNSYIVHKENEKYVNDFVDNYFTKLDNIINDENKIKFDDFKDLYFLYLDWYKERIGDQSCDNYKVYFEDKYEETRYKSIVLLPLSFAPNIKKFNTLYSAPIIPFIGVSYMTHDVYKHPCWHIRHDFLMHGDYIINIYTNITNMEEYFKKSKEIIEQIIKEDDITNIIFFDLIHEDGIHYFNHQLKLDNDKNMFNNIKKIIDVVINDKNFIYYSSNLFDIITHKSYSNMDNHLFDDINDANSFNIQKYKEHLKIIGDIIKEYDNESYKKKYIKYKHKYLNIKRYNQS